MVNNVGTGIEEKVVSKKKLVAKKAGKKIKQCTWKGTKFVVKNSTIGSVKGSVALVIDSNETIMGKDGSEVSSMIYHATTSLSAEKDIAVGTAKTIKMGFKAISSSAQITKNTVNTIKTNIEAKRELREINSIWIKKLESASKVSGGINCVLARSSEEYQKNHNNDEFSKLKDKVVSSNIPKIEKNRNIRNDKDKNIKKKKPVKLSIKKKISMLLKNKAASSMVNKSDNNNVETDANQKIVKKVKNKAKIKIIAIVLSVISSLFVSVIMPVILIICVLMVVPPFSWLFASDSGDVITLYDRLHELNIEVNKELNDGAYIKSEIDIDQVNQEIVKLYYAKTGKTIGVDKVDNSVMDGIIGKIYGFKIKTVQVVPSDKDFIAEYEVSTVTKQYDSTGTYEYGNNSCMEHAIDMNNLYSIPGWLEKEYDKYICYNALPIEVDEKSIWRIGDFLYIQSPKDDTMYACVVVGKNNFSNNNHIGFCAYDGRVLSTMYHSDNSIDKILFDVVQEFNLLQSSDGSYTTEHKMKVYYCRQIYDDTAMQLLPYGILGDELFDRNKENGFNTNLYIYKKQVTVFNYDSIYMKGQSDYLNSKELERYKEIEQSIKDNPEDYKKYIDKIYNGSMKENIAEFAKDKEGSEEYSSSVEFINSLYAHIGVYVPDNLVKLNEFCDISGYKISEDKKLEIGDMIFGGDILGNPSKVEIYIGSGQFAYIQDGRVVIDNNRETKARNFSRIIK